MTTKSPLEEQITRNEPTTHFFYEHEGPRAVDPWLLIRDAIVLWHENVYANDTHDNIYLWEYAKSRVDQPQPTPSHSWVEWLRQRIILGSINPPRWNTRKPFPYKGLLISAIYLHEARRLCDQGQEDRAWHIIAMAYYYLGQNTPRNTSQNAARAAKLMQAARTENLRGMVLGALDVINEKKSANSIKEAQDQVIEVLRSLAKDPNVSSWIAEFDAAVSDKVKGRRTGAFKSDVLNRLRESLETWALPSGPYPEIAEAFACFNKRDRKRTPSKHVVPPENSEGIELDDSDYYLRFVHYLGDEFLLTQKLSRTPDTSESKPVPPAPPSDQEGA